MPGFPITTLVAVFIALFDGVKAVASCYKTELVALAVVGLALLFASPFDRYLIGGAVAMSFALGLKLGHRSSSAGSTSLL